MRITKAMMLACTPTWTQWSKNQEWRFDYFNTKDDADIWAARRKKEGCYDNQIRITRTRHTAPGLKQWYVTSKHGIFTRPRPFYPKVKYSHCRHCDERITLIRVGPGGRSPQPYLAKRGVKQYNYKEEPVHSCPGKARERASLTQFTNELSNLLNKVLRPRRAN